MVNIKASGVSKALSSPVSTLQLLYMDDYIIMFVQYAL